MLPIALTRHNAFHRLKVGSVRGADAGLLGFWDGRPSPPSRPGRSHATLHRLTGEQAVISQELELDGQPSEALAARSSSRAARV